MIKKFLDKLEFNAIKNKLAENCYTYNGKKIAKDLTPYSKEEDVKSALFETTEAVCLNHSCGSLPIFEIDDQTLNIKKLKSKINLSAKSLIEIATILKTARELKKYSKDSNVEIPHISIFFEELYSNDSIETKIFKSIISENEIADNASSTLASIRRNKKNIELAIRNKLNAMIHSSSYSKYIMDPIVTIRNERFVIPIKEEYRVKVKGFVHDVSSSGSTLYIEPLPTFEMNNKLNDLLIEENKEIEKILENLSQLLIPVVNDIEHTYYLIGKLDFINAKAKISISDDYTCPEIASFIDLKKARHPLISKELVVPININIGKKDFKTLVITGPNTGGKTVSLKTVGLLCAMAQSGLHIPVNEGSCIKIFDNIYADIGDEQSIESSLSTFSAHISNIVQILNTFTEKSLILVDELGAGTDPIEGSNLAISLLESFHNKGAFTIATTHYSEIKNYCLTHDGFENASVEFDLKTLKPTYHLLLGIPGKSNAFAISKQLGIPEEIITRASSLISKPDTDIETLMKQIYDNKIKIEEDRKEIEKNLNQVTQLRKKLELENSDKLIHEQEKIEKAKKEARQIILDAKDESSKIIKRLNNMDSSDLSEANALRNKLNSSANKLKNSGIDLSVLLELNNKNTNQLSNSSKKTKKSVYIQNNKAKSISAEINLLGETVDSAVAELDKYLDNCKMAHLHQVRVVHGKGTGKLREGIHKYLKKSKYVDSFRIGSYGEGDYGVTIVNLKQ
ncbi:MAG: endonuclease MutS2 [Clostridia bacterium]|nr:endonuclease MutS2 [Clostridia bacterium]